ncbi:hypothetical protein [Cytophaga aurantiaca]|uniref:hypothetical protein n=1 Tax=Cytophaga aurantiaca TaxID=29530 RepID=UPI000364F2ED|nr:hypothetical protein [Cytophaga aurantiaca]
MNITTENIDEWCFRYLEKDLNDEERVFFEKELKNNSSLAKQFSFWKKTIIKPEALTKLDSSVTKDLFRYRNQFSFILIEFVLTTSLALCLLYNTPIEVQHIENAPPSTTVSSPSVKSNKDSAFIDGIKFYKPAHINLLLDQQHDSVIVLQNDEIKNIAPDTALSNTNPILSIPEEQNQKDTIQITSDTTVSQKKSTQKKTPAKHKYRGSRLIPINNDL